MHSCREERGESRQDRVVRRCMLSMLSTRRYSRSPDIQYTLPMLDSDQDKSQLDHFPNSPRYEPHTNRTFKQHYYIDSSYYKPSGPVILLLGGESAAAGLAKVEFQSGGRSLSFPKGNCLTDALNLQQSSNSSYNNSVPSGLCLRIDTMAPAILSIPLPRTSYVSSQPSKVCRCPLHALDQPS